MKLHIELTNRCILKCIACPRTEWNNILKKPVEKKDLDYELLDKFLDCDGAKNIDVFELCGDYGDCIYYPKLIELIKHFRSNKKFYISTNGSRKNSTFWQELASLMTTDDKIIFAIDGLQHNNHLYRENSDWESTINGLEIMVKSPATVVWQTIIFKFNQNQLNEIKNFAESKGARFTVLNTHRYGDDSLVPDKEYIETKYLFNEDYNNKNFIIKPKCGYLDYIPTIGCDGIFYPCDWLRNPKVFYKSDLWKYKEIWLEKLKIENYNYDQCNITIKNWAAYVRQNSIENKSINVLCKMKCRENLNE